MTGDGRDTISAAVGAAWSPLLARRVRSMARLVPVFDAHINRHRNPSQVPFERYDVLTLVQVLVDAAVLDVGLRGGDGVPREHLVEQVADVAGRMAPDRSRDEHEQVAWRLLSVLGRYDEPTVKWVSEWFDPARDWERVSDEFEIVVETTTLDGTVLVRVDPAMVVLLLVAAGHDLADDQVGKAAIMRAQLDSGRFASAAETAELQLRLSRAFAASLRGLIDAAERDVTGVSWSAQLGPKVDEAADHLDARVRDDGALLRHVLDARRAAADPDEVGQLERVTAMLRTSQRELTELQRWLIDASARFRAAQATQAFDPAPASVVDPTRDVLDPMLRGGAPVVTATVSPVVPGVAMSFGGIVDHLTRPTKQTSDPERDAPSGEALEAVAAARRAFSASHHATTEAIRSAVVPVGGKARLSELLDAADRLAATGLPGEVVDAHDGDTVAALGAVRLLLAFDALLTWAPDGDRPDDAWDDGTGSVWWAVDDGTTLDAVDLLTADLAIHREESR